MPPARGCATGLCTVIPLQLDDFLFPRDRVGCTTEGAKNPPLSVSLQTLTNKRLERDCPSLHIICSLVKPDYVNTYKLNF